MIAIAIAIVVAGPNEGTHYRDCTLHYFTRIVHLFINASARAIAVAVAVDTSNVITFRWLFPQPPFVRCTEATE